MKVKMTLNPHLTNVSGRKDNIMALIDTYRNAVLHKQEEIRKLENDLAKEQAKITPQRQKILSAESAIKRTKSSSTIKSKLNEIERAEKAITDIEKRKSDIQKKITQKKKELSTAEKNYRNEEAKEDKRRQKEADKQINSMVNAIQENTYQQNILAAEIEQLKVLPQKITVLFMASNPTDTSALRLDEEARAIQERIRLSDYRDSINFETRWATRSSDILQAINETNPTIVHFSGHGTSTGELVLQNPDGTAKLVTKEAITAAMTTASDTIRLVVFNACFSEMQAQNLVQNIEAAIGMSSSVGDEAACVFASQLYSSIGFGRSLQASFNQAIAALLLEGIPEEKTPVLCLKDGLDPNDLVLVEPQ